MTEPDAPSFVPASPVRRLLLRVFPGRSLVELEAVVPDLATGLRAACATVIPLALSVYGARPELSWMALGGWLGTLADPGGSRSGRARPLVAFAIVGALVVGASEAGARSLVAAMLLVAGVAFFAAALRALGSSASTLGTMLSIVAALATGSRSREPLRDALWFAAGSSLAVVLSSIVWPVWTHLPVRRALATVFRELERYVREIDGCVTQGAPEDDPRWALAGRVHARRIREAIEKARAVSLAIYARRSGESPMGSNLRVLLGMAESQFLLLVTLASEVETSASRPRTVDVPALLGSLARTYDAIAAILVARAWSPRAAPPPGPSSRDVTGDALRELASDLIRESEAARSIVGALDRRATVLVQTGASEDTVRSALALDWRVLRDALLPGSPLLHHAIRAATAGATAVIVGQLLSPRHAPWVTVTALAVLQPDSGATVKRAAERIAGTVFGGLIAVAITATRAGPIALTAMMFPPSIAAVVTRPRSYRLFTFFLTPIFVLIAMRMPGDWWVAAARAGDTMVGGGIALVATLLIFPRWQERVGLPSALAAMARDAQGYATLVVTTLGGRDDAAARRIIDARLLAAAAIGRAESALERLLENPLRTRDEGFAMELVTYARRLTLAATTLETLASKRTAGRPVPLEAALARVRRFESLLRRAAEESRAG